MAIAYNKNYQGLQQFDINIDPSGTTSYVSIFPDYDVLNNNSTEETTTISTFGDRGMTRTMSLSKSIIYSVEGYAKSTVAPDGTITAIDPLLEYLLKVEISNDEELTNTTARIKRYNSQIVTDEATPSNDIPVKISDVKIINGNTNELIRVQFTVSIQGKVTYTIVP